MEKFDMDKGEPGEPISKDMKIMPSGKVLCPNHGCELEGVPFPLPEKGSAQCPVSGAMFTYEAKVDPQLNITLKDGTVTRMSKWEITGDEI